MEALLLPALVGYGVGSLPLGFVIASWVKGVDLRRVGSGNVGAANVQRSVGLGMALLVVALDAAKGLTSVAVAVRLASGIDPQVAAGVGAIVGHVAPVWLRFRGGKGVATACGVFMVLAPLPTAIAAVGFVATVWTTRYVSLGSIMATAALPPVAWMLDSPVAVVAGGTIAALVIIPRHAANMSRLAGGTERRLGQRV
jgi:acyl phosphate:glycerol-3-phosphate acyltransferase